MANLMEKCDAIMSRYGQETVLTVDQIPSSVEIDVILITSSVCIVSNILFQILDHTLFVST